MKNYQNGKAPNYQGGLVEAHKQFVADLKQDKDFIAYKERAVIEEHSKSYGVVIARGNRFTIEQVNDEQFDNN